MDADDGDAEGLQLRADGMADLAVAEDDGFRAGDERAEGTQLGTRPEDARALPVVGAVESARMGEEAGDDRLGHDRAVERTVDAHDARRHLGVRGQQLAPGGGRREDAQALRAREPFLLEFPHDGVGGGWERLEEGAFAAHDGDLGARAGTFLEHGE